METRAIKIKSKADSSLIIKIIPGHFATNHSHINFYIDMNAIKYRNNMAHNAAYSLAKPYSSTTPVDTIVCVDGSEMLGGFMAYELTQNGLRTLNKHKDIYVITPEFNFNGQLVFRDNIQPMVWGKNIILLVASATTGKSINRLLECIKYYGGNIVGISAIFSAIKSQQDHPVYSLFTADDLPDYKSFSFSDCPYCRNKQKIDAIVNSFGYSKI